MTVGDRDPRPAAPPQEQDDLDPLASAPLRLVQVFGDNSIPDIPELDGPAAIVDVAIVRRNCELMLSCTEALGVGFRAHVKTHKTVEVTRFQVGEAPNPVKIVVSTVAEALHLLPFLKDCQLKGREISVSWPLMAFVVGPQSFVCRFYTVFLLPRQHTTGSRRCVWRSENAPSHFSLTIPAQLKSP